MEELKGLLELLPISQVREILRTLEDQIVKNPNKAGLWAYHRVVRQVLGFDE